MTPPRLDPDSLYRFGAVELDVGRREIRVDGQRIETQPKVFDLLLYLIEHRDRIVDKAELMDALWPDGVVTEASLTQALKKARKIVGDDANRQSVIRTAQRRGFRFVADIEVATSERAPDAAPHAPAPDAPPPNSVAVLPFLDLSPQADQQYFCDGMAEEIINSLTRIEGLRVAARASSFAFRGTHKGVSEIGQQLGVEALVDGSVRRAGNALRVTARLADTETGYQRWSEQWDRPIHDVFAIQDEIATGVAQALDRHLSSADRVSIASLRPSAVDAYDLYLRGLAFQHAFGRSSQRLALEMFERVIEREPEFAPAWAGIASSHVLLYMYAEATDEHRHLAAEAGARAVELDPLSADAHGAQGNAATLRGDFPAADAAFKRAQMLDPRSFEAWYYHGRSLASRGEHSRAVAAYEQAALVRPEDYQALNFAMQSLRSLGRMNEALSATRRSVRAAERALLLNPADVCALSVTAGLLVDLDRPDDARAWVERACTLEPDEPFVQYNAACTYARLNEPERALDHLERVGVEAMASRSGMEHDSQLDSLRTHPRFLSLLDRAR